ncbi:DUF7220 family protein [Bradyrhizobium betae]|nr:hypothetical protein [Bradyrhizobium betae]MCS3725472.1 hypothetical protein [Bradyrhizobium betae]
MSTAIGFAVALLAQIFVFPLFGFRPALHENLMITAIFTVVSIVRQFVMRRLFERLHIRRPLSPFMQAVIAERFRQIEQEGWDATHDDAHRQGEMAQAGAAYALGNETVFCDNGDDIRGNCVRINGQMIWPWAVDWWKPKEFRRNQVRAAALIVAEGEKFDRARNSRRETKRSGNA